MSGALLTLTPAGFGPLVVTGLWGAFAIGSVKAGRHVFWLAEEHQRPRVFGFLPIALLGAQFLGLYAIYPGLHVEFDWLGFGCVLVAIPMLATADALARVFEQRTGNLVRPMPWSILTPMLVGLILCSAAMALSGTDPSKSASACHHCASRRPLPDREKPFAEGAVQGEMPFGDGGQCDLLN